MRLFRLFTIINTFAHYRLDQLLSDSQSKIKYILPPLLWLLPGRWLPCSTPKHKRLREALEKLGPFYIKMGQLLATRHDLFEVSILNELKNLQDNVSPFDAKTARGIIDSNLESLGYSTASDNSPFASIETKPLAAASIAQVHGAILKAAFAGTEHDQDVVIKVLRPNVREQIIKDMNLLSWLASMVTRFWADANLFQVTRAVSDYRTIILNELDLIKEADNSLLMRSHFEHSPLVYIPFVHKPLCFNNMMVMNRIDGIPVNDVAIMDDLGLNRRLLAQKGVRIFFKQVFEFNFFHADMHPGNIFVNKHRLQDPQFLTVDCAIVGTLTADNQLLLAKLIMALVQDDHEKLIRLIHRAGWLPSDCVLTDLREDMARVVAPLAHAKMADINFAETLMDVFIIIRQYRIRLPLNFMLLLKTLVHIEGLGRQIDPTLDIWAEAIPIIKEWLTEKLGPEATLKKMFYRSPEWLSNLPDMPDQIYDATKSLQSLDIRLIELNKNLERQAKYQNKRRQRIGSFIALAGIAAITLSLFPTWLAQIPLLEGLIASLRTNPLLSIGIAGIITSLIIWR